MMFVRTLNYPHTKVVFGEGSMEYLKDIKGRKVLVTTRSLIGGKLYSQVLGLTEAEVLQGPSQHTPEEQMRALGISGFDVVISLGGGSIIDGVKALSPKFHVAIPTTLSGAEHTEFAGFTSKGRKVSVQGKEPDLVILDPKALTETPRELLLSSGVRAIDHAIEAFYSARATPFTDVLAEGSYRRLVQCLPQLPSTAEECQGAAWGASLAMRYAGRGLSHVFGYVVGPRFKIPHGITSCISLPAAIEMNKTPKLRQLEVGNPLNEEVGELLNKLGLRRKLGQYCSLEEAMGTVEELTEAVNRSDNPRKLSSKEVRKFLEDVF
jgi:maleylacetate reductase